MTTLLDALEVAIEAHQDGRIIEADAIYREILKITPDNPDALHLLGLLNHQIGNHQVAYDLILQAIEAQPDIAEFYNSIGNVLSDLKMFPEAEAAYKNAILLNPDAPEFHTNLGVTLHMLNKMEEGIIEYRRAVELDPTSADVYNNLGNGLRIIGQYDEALKQYLMSVALDGSFYHGHFNLSSLYQKFNQLDKATYHCHQVIRHQPDFNEAYGALASLYEQQGNTDEAIVYYHEAIRRKPGHWTGYYTLATLLTKLERYSDAEPLFRQTLDLFHDHVDALLGLGNALYHQGKVQESLAYFDKASLMCPERTLWKWRSEFICPLIFQTSQEIDHYRETAVQHLDEYLEKDFTFDLLDMLVSNSNPSFFLSYHGRDDLALKSKYGDIFSKILYRDYPHLMEPPKPKYEGQQKIRLGIMVSQGHEGVFCKLTLGFINLLPRDKFDITIVCTASSQLYLSKRITNPETHYCIFTNEAEYFPDVVMQIKAQQFDALLYYEINTEVWNYFLPFFKLAPVQFTCYGLPVTTGIPQMDYFVSSNLVEAPDGEKFYREKMFRLETEPIYFYRPVIEKPSKTKQDFGIPTDCHFYLCPQNLFKCHPDFDPILAGILERDPKAQIYFIHGVFPEMSDQLQIRFENNIPDADRIHFLPRVTHEDFLNLLAIADVALDTVHYTGGTTSYETLFYGTPLVTMPTKHTRGRQTLGNYNSMKFYDCVVHSPDEYIDLAVRLGTDPDFRQQMKEKILSQHHILYENPAVIQEMERFLIIAVEQAKRDDAV